MNKRIRVAALLATALMSSAVHAASYYFSPGGSDSNPGTQSFPFASLDKLNTLDLDPGDTVYLQGGGIFNGNIQLDASDTATTPGGTIAGAPIRITSYGVGKAKINAGDGTALYSENNGNIEISNLHLVGSGSTYDNAAGRYVYSNTGNGIEFNNTLAGNIRHQNIVINNVTAEQFGRNGIWFGASTGQSGYEGIRITNAVAHTNQLAGIAMMGDFQNGNRANFHNVYISRSHAYNNPGEDGQPAKGNSGNGIVIGQVKNGIIERSVANNNGYLCESVQGGPVGIWAWDSDTVVIQKNYSHHNGTGGPHDGGGFDLDGGVINSVMQHNFSSDNAGAGYLLAQFSGAKTFSNNTVRYNISHNDGRKNGYGGIHAFSAINNTDVYNNTIFLKPALVADSDGEAPAAVKFRFFSGENLRFFNNLFMVEGDSNDATVDPELLSIADGLGLIFQRNAYWNKGLSGTFNSRDLEALYLSISNLPGLAGILDEAPLLFDADDLDSLTEYGLNDDSPLVDAGLYLPSLGIPNWSGFDFFGFTQRGDSVDIGAVENQSGAIPAPEPTSLASIALVSAGLLRRRRSHS